MHSGDFGDGDGDSNIPKEKLVGLAIGTDLEFLRCVNSVRVLLV